jgi:DNA-binding Lrp family transcriptional regulator
MRRLYLLINTMVGKEKMVRDAIRRMEGVRMCDMITGRYDIVVVIEEKSEEVPFAIVLEKIRMVEGITKTETNLVVE